MAGSAALLSLTLCDSQFCPLRQDCLFTQCGRPCSSRPAADMQDKGAQQAFVKGLHLLRTDLFMTLIEEGSLPLRPGVKRLVGKAFID